MRYVLKCSACELEIPVTTIVARMMKNNRSGQSFCPSCGASDSVTLVERFEE